MPGYERSRIVGIDQIQLEEFTCGVCQDVLCRPVVTACCRQSYCKDCIDDWLRRHNTCPNDRKLLTSAGLSDAPRMVTNFLDKLKIKCEHFASGCRADIRIGQLADHVSHCPFDKCPRCGCKEPLVGHNCVQDLLDEVKNLKEQVAKLSVEVDNNDLISAIKAAKGMKFEIADRVNVPYDLAKLFGLKAKNLLAKFNAITKSIDDFFAELDDKIYHINEDKAMQTEWFVTVHLEGCAVGQCHRDKSRVVLKFGKLVIVVSDQEVAEDDSESDTD